MCRIKHLVIVSFACLCVLFVSPALAEDVTVTASGKDAPTAELNARVAAVRQVLQETAAMDFLVSRMDLVRNEFIAKSRDFTSTVTLLSSTTEAGVVRVKATVDTDREKIRQRLLGIDPKAVAAKAPEPAPVAPAAPAGPILADRDFLKLFTITEDGAAQRSAARLEAIRNGGNVKAVPAAEDIASGFYGKIKPGLLEGRTALMLMLQHDRVLEAKFSVPVIEALLAAGAEINILDKYGISPLGIAAGEADPRFGFSGATRFPEVLSALLKAGADPKWTSADTGKGVLHLMVERENSVALSLIQPLLEAGADVNARDNKQNTPLILAAKEVDEGRPALLSALLKAGADVNAVNKEGNSAILTLVHQARLADDTKHYLESVKVLLAAGPEMNLPEKPVILAAMYHNQPKSAEYPELYTLLKDAGADVNALNKNGESALVAFCDSSDYTSMLDNLRSLVAWLLANGADPNLKNRDGRTALHLNLSFPEIATTLLEAGADPNARDKDGRSPLMHLLHARGKPELIALMLEKTDKNAVDDKGNTPLHIAAQAHDAYARDSAKAAAEKNFTQILAAGFPVNAQNQDGATALHLLDSSMPLPLWEALLKAGADPNLADKDGKTALDRFIGQTGWINLQFAKLLLDAGAKPEATKAGSKNLLENIERFITSKERGSALHEEIKKRLTP